MSVYVEGRLVSFSQNLSVECSYVSSTFLRRPGLFGRAARLTLTVCDGFDSLTSEFPFVVQRDLPTDVVFGSDWCAYRRDAADHHNVSLPLSELVISDDDSSGSSVSVSSDVSQAGSPVDVDVTQAGSFANLGAGDATKIRKLCASSLFVFGDASLSFNSETDMPCSLYGVLVDLRAFTRSRAGATVDSAYSCFACDRCIVQWLSATVEGFLVWLSISARGTLPLELEIDARVDEGFSDEPVNGVGAK
ncbi:hypothetical protein AZE42_09201 [Rhizopogon vesiculosus]|uniref:Uncharacterized protein n=1 Tax=Rhizopogon vesiculosus TaxID=180088 RepID=A0A1J8QD76_9AGAM|nr:hypothetical protein AZE42_09201 [Rhizopogon vesiculosus]